MMSFNLPLMMKQAREMKSRMEELQTRAGDMEVEGTAGGETVKIVMTCKGEVREVSIAPAAVDPASRDMLEDLVKAAVNAARAAADARMAEETRKMMESLGLPANMALPF